MVVTNGRERGVVSAATQRRLALYVFCAVQAVKLAAGLAAVLPSHSDSSRQDEQQQGQQVDGTPSLTLAGAVWLWCALDAAFVAGLRRARVPWLTLSACGSLTLAAALCVLNLGVAAALAGIFMSSMSPMSPMSSAGGSPLLNAPASLQNLNQYNYQTQNQNNLNDRTNRNNDASARPPAAIDELFNASHILGSHTVTVRPPTVAQLNPNASVFCIPSARTPFFHSHLQQQQQQVLIPILVRGTPPFNVEFEFFPDTAGPHAPRSVHAITLAAGDEVVPVLRSDGSLDSLVKNPAAAADKSAPKRHLGLFAIPAPATGIYRLLSIREPSGDDGKIAASRHVQVVQCPSASWHWASQNQQQQQQQEQQPIQDAPSDESSPAPVPEDADDGHPLFDRCTDDTFTALIQVHGVPPLTIMYIKQVGTTEIAATVDSTDLFITSDTDSVTSPEPHGSLWGIITPSMRSKPQPLDTDTKKLLQTNRVIQTTIPVSFTVDQQAEHVFRIARVIDGFNNTVDYQTHSTVDLPDPLQKSTALQLQVPGDLFVVRGHGHPSVKFTDCDDVKIRSGESRKLSLSLHGEAPFIVSIRHAVSDTDEGHVDRFDNLAGPTAHIDASSPGAYNLIDVRDRFCTGSAQLPSKCLVQRVIAPTMTLSSSPIEEKCLGAVGANMNLSFTGEPPFWVEYVEERVSSPSTSPHGNQQQQQRVDRRIFMIDDIRKPRHSLALSPVEPGTYQYTFTRIGDAYYREGVALTGMIVTQIIHPHSTAQFTGSESRYVRCVNDTVKLPVIAQGSGPWTLIYYIVHNTQRTRYSIHVPINHAGVVDLVVDQLTSSGAYLIDLAEITDVNGCTETISSPGRSIEVLSQRPTVNFQTTRPIHVIEGGRVSLPISVSGKPPFEVRYRSGNRDIQTSRDGRDLEVFGAGSFELLSIRDKFCEGEAVDPRVLEVVQIPRPSLTVSDDVVRDMDICLGVHDGVLVALIGKPPFVVEYQHTFVPSPVSSSSVAKSRPMAAVKPDINIRRVETRADTFPLVFDTTRAGMHTYRILSISDANYVVPKRLGSSSSSPESFDGIELRRRVSRPPTARFDEPGERVYQCSGTSTSTTSSNSQGVGSLVLAVRLTGVPPFALAIDRKFDNMPTSRLNFTRSESDLVRETRMVDTGSGIPDEGHVWMTRVDLGVLEQQGRYDFVLASVVDGTGCSAFASKTAGAGASGLSGGSGSAAANAAADAAVAASVGASPASVASGTIVSIHVADQAKITSTNPPTVCVGDILTYRLQGSPPFTVGYTWRGIAQPDIVVADPVMTLWAGAAGDVVITHVCNAMGCCNTGVASDPAMHASVKALPRAITDGGHDTVDDIREGDESEVVVEFVGEPPFGFSYSYAKSVHGAASGASNANVGGSSSRSLRNAPASPPQPPSQPGTTTPLQPAYTSDDLVSLSVTGIDTHTWRLRTSQEGVFRVTAVHDRFCGYPRIIQSTMGANAILK